MQDFSNSSPASLSAEDFDQSFREVDLGARVDGPIRTTFHVYKSDERIGFFLEKVFDEQGRLIRMTKRTADGRSETRFDPSTGDIDKIFETYTMPDGNILTKEKRYLPDDNSLESVIVVDPQGNLVRTVLREMKSLKSVFTGQTEYNRQGKAILTVNHWFDKITAKLSVREQIQWLSNGERGVTEHFTFTKDGSLVKYHKSLVHPPTDSYMEEIHLYDPRSQSLLRKEVKTYERHDLQAEVEITIYDTRGHQLEQKTVIEKRHLT
ncbi:MAG: hypothetical protein SFV17_04370 [Candidatus Obscuribacter sp.]|nr:hypothetical protein [Candidatus Obscuribacter sp.]